ncbi:uncharacterized protein LOC120271624 [Dioscorea cayenensis subsp. rotundata]|uniref:Uncharacterized protein LOC120271624 n=1 Tax=Dioscorea cayennensis subsp. rotundata TaxID=55577 RepID=A0AB40C5T6_DIOCR|nr:uncharacterized protein LOC120271624 [Dioscorea cayenensis subsp. rotundata]
MICRQIQALVQQQPSINVSVLIAEIKNRYGYTPTYRKVWTTKQKEVEATFGNWEESYNELPRWLSALQQFVPATIVDLETQPAYDGPYLVRDAQIFHRVFWSFPACVEAFKYCKPVVQIDGTHIYGKYKGTLLLAIAQDGNKNILPIGFAIVEGETLGAWTFFLRNLRSSVTPQQGICFISNCHESIKSAFRSLGREMSAPYAYRVYCIRHISANFMRRFRNKEMLRIIVNIGYSKTIQDFNYWYGLLWDNDEEATRWLDNIPREKWAQAFDKKGRRYGHMTTNLAECVNSVLKGTRNLPITAMVKSTYFRLAELFVRKGVQVQAQIASFLIFSESLMKAI